MKFYELKQFLQDRRISCSDQRKEVLIKLSPKSLELCPPEVKNFQKFHRVNSELPNYVGEWRESKISRMQDFALIWSENLIDMPNVEWLHIIVYLMLSCG